jgi:hypothetical protein
MSVTVREQQLLYLTASCLRRHPLNWRFHPAEQTDALRDMFGAVGFVGALLAFRILKRWEAETGRTATRISRREEVAIG